MTWFRRLWHRKRMEEQLEKELGFHMEQTLADLMAQGIAREEALRRARLSFGAPDLIREECRDARRTRWLEDAVQDFRYTLRTLRRTPAFSAAAILILALGIGANTAMFTVVNALILRPLPYSDPSRLVWITQILRSNTADQVTLTPDFLEWRARTQTFATLAAFNPWTRNLTRVAEAAALPAAKASSDLLPALGIQPMLGRNFTRQEDLRGNDHVAILTHGLWQRAFAADPKILGTQVTLDGEPFTVVGVLPKDMLFPAPNPVEILTPLGKSEAVELKRGDNITVVQNVIGRLKPGVNLEQARAELEVIQAGLQPPSNMPALRVSIRAMPLHTHLNGNVTAAVLALFGAVCFLLLITCANVASLLLARTVRRGREIAIRSALGGSRGRLVRQFLTESLVLAAAGSALGLLMARGTRGAVLAINPANIPTLSRLSFDWRVVAFAAICSIATAVAFGLAPALFSTRLELSDSLKGTGGPVAGGRRPRRWLAGLAVSELAVAVVLLTGACLMLQSFWRLRYTNLGFQSDRLLTARVPLNPSRYRDRARQVDFVERAVGRLQTLPGVESVAIADNLPPGFALPTNTFAIEGRALAPMGSRPIAQFPTVSPEYFQAMGIPLLSGRLLQASDTELAPLVVVVSKTFVNAYFPNEDAVGKRLRTGSLITPFETIVGVVGDVKSSGLTTRPQPVIYHPYRQTGSAVAYFILRTALPPDLLAGPLRKELANVDPDQPVAKIQTMDERLTSSVTQPRFAAVMLSLFGGLAVLLSSIGIYSVMACIVGWQTKEIGIRRALGAQGPDVLRVTFGQGARILVLGLGFGIAGSLSLTRAMKSLLFEIHPGDPLTLCAVSVILALVTLAACCLPARRALQVDPAVALRYD